MLPNLHTGFSRGRSGGLVFPSLQNFPRFTVIHTVKCGRKSLTAKSEEELKSLLMKVKEEGEKVGLKRNIQKVKIMASDPIASWEIDGETVETVSDFILGLQNHCRW